MPNVTISVTNDGGLTDPAPLILAVRPPPIKTWPDSGPGAHHANAIGAPMLRKNVLNGYPVVDLLSATQDGFDLVTPLSGAGNTTIFVVMKANSPTAKLFSIAGSVADGTPYGPYSHIDGTTYAVSRATYVVGQGVSDAFHVVTSYMRNGVYTTLYKDGVEILSGAGAFTSIGDYSRIGYTPGGFSDGSLAEIVFCDIDLQPTDMQNAQKTLAAKYGTPTPPAGSVIDLATLPSLKGWWKADSLDVPVLDAQNTAEGFGGGLSMLDAGTSDTGTHFTSTGGILDHVTLWPQQSGAPVGDLVCHIWSGDLTTLLATSNPIPAASIPTTLTTRDFRFIGANRITLLNGTGYAVMLARTAAGACGCGASYGSRISFPGSAWVRGYDGQWVNYAGLTEPFQVYVTK